MEPIINPLWFYLIDTLSGFGSMFCAIGGVSVGALIIGSIVAICFDLDSLKNLWKMKVIKIITILSIVLIVTGSFIPSESTAYKMLVASLVTPNNITAVGESATNVVDYIVESVDKIIESNESVTEESE